MLNHFTAAFVFALLITICQPINAQNSTVPEGFQVDFNQVTTSQSAIETIEAQPIPPQDLNQVTTSQSTIESVETVEAQPNTPQDLNQVTTSQTTIVSVETEEAQPITPQLISCFESDPFSTAPTLSVNAGTYCFNATIQCTDAYAKYCTEDQAADSATIILYGATDATDLSVFSSSVSQIEFCSTDGCNYSFFTSSDVPSQSFGLNLPTMGAGDSDHDYDHHHHHHHMTARVRERRDREHSHKTTHESKPTWAPRHKDESH